MNASLPSQERPARERRERAVRRVLDDHRRTEVGCVCGWKFPRGLIGFAAHRDHLAARVVEAV